MFCFLFSSPPTRFLFIHCSLTTSLDFCFVYLFLPTTVSVSVCMCVNLFCVYFCSDLLSLSLFALSCSLMFSIALSLARPPAQNLSPFSLPSLSVLFSFSHSLALTHTHVSHRVACLCFLLSLSRFPFFFLFCYAFFLFRNSHFIARPTFPILPSVFFFLFVFASFFPTCFCIVFFCLLLFSL